jgi:hypothetical protein
MRQVFHAIDPSLPAPNVRPLDDALDTYLMPQRIAAWVSGALGTFGLLLALVGVYGAMGLTVVASKVVAGVRTFDPVVMAAFPAMLVVTTAMAAFAPARRLVRGLWRRGYGRIER